MDPEDERNPWFPFVWERDLVAQSPRTGVRSLNLHLHADAENQIIRLNNEGTVNMNAFIDALEQVINEATVELAPTGRDRLGVTITGFTSEEQEIRIGIPFRPYQELTPFTILASIEQKLNSATSLIADFDISFSVLERLEPRQLDLRGKSRRAIFKGNFMEYVGRSRCIIEIHPEADPYKESQDCFWQFLALGLAHLVEIGSIDPPENLEITAATFKELRTGRSRFKRRHEIATSIQNIFGESIHNTDDIRRVQAHFGIQLVLYNMTHQMAIDYPDSSDLPLEFPVPTIFGIIQENSDDSFNHVHYVTKPASLDFGKTKSESQRMCNLCYQIYTRKRYCDSDNCRDSTLMDRCTTCHVCDKACRTCCTTECGRFVPQESAICIPYEDMIKCNVCKKGFYSQRCEILHEANCSAANKILCDVCGKSQHRGRKCDELYCYMCAEKISQEDVGSHLCYLKPETLKAPQQNYWVYDFETCLSNDKTHMLYLCTVTPVYPEFYKKELEVLQGIFPYQNVGDLPVFVFWGLGDAQKETGVYQFFHFLTHPCLQNSIFFAHNAGKYDVIFIENHMAKFRNLIGSKIQRGLKIVYLNFPEIGICFKDTINFIPTSLRNMSSDFGIEELKKGYFPHSIMTESYLKEAEKTFFIVPRPDAKVFKHDFHVSSHASEEKELEQFQEEWKKQPPLWNLKLDAVEYCISDTVLLAKTIRVFKEKTELLTNAINRRDDIKESVNLDPFQFLTLPSAVMKFYMSQILPKETIAIIDRYKSVSKITAHEWIAYMEYKEGQHIFRVNHFEGLPIIGYLEDEDGKLFLFRYLDCYHNGCSKCFPSHKRNLRRNMSFKECLYEMKRTEDVWWRENMMSRSPAPNVEIITCWGHDWENMKMYDTEVRKWVNDYQFDGDDRAPLDPREAYKGGHTEMYKMRHQGEISMVDFVSQYPTSLMGTSFSPYTGSKIEWNMPIGHPIVLEFPPIASFDFERFDMGVIKCTVVPPKNLYAPFLGCKVPSEIQNGTYEMIYGLCKACMFERRNDSCTHSENDRAILGTWTLAEIKYSVSLGYRITHITEIWYYPKKTNVLFADFIIPFMIKKMCCKTTGLIDKGSFTDKGIQVCQYVKEISGQELVIEDFVNSPAERNIAKLMMNSFYGKWGQRSIWDESRAFNESQEEDCKRLLMNNALIIKFAEVIQTNHGKVVVVDYEQRISVGKGDNQKNDHIAAYVTAYGRIMLNKVLQAVGRNAIYTDTDSVFHSFTNNLPYNTGFRTGDLELELPKGKDWTCCGRKFYAYRKMNEAVVCKQKGVTLKKSMVPLFTPQALDSLVRNTFKELESLDAEDESEAMVVLKKLKNVEGNSVPAIVVTQTLFKTVRENKLTATKKTVEMKKKAMFLVWAMKRRALFLENGDIDTLPYGWEE